MCHDLIMYDARNAHSPSGFLSLFRNSPKIRSTSSLVGLPGIEEKNGIGIKQKEPGKIPTG